MAGSNLNSVLIEGCLEKDPLYRVTPKGTPVCTFAIISKRYRRGEDGPEVIEEVSCIGVEVWGKLAEHVRDGARKGRGVRVVGYVREDHWQSCSGERMSKVVIVAEHVELRPMPEAPAKKRSSTKKWA